MLLRVVAILALISLMAEGAQRQRWRGRRYEPLEPLELTIAPNYSFARVQFQSFRSRRNPGWSHDYPRAERNLLRDPLRGHERPYRACSAYDRSARERRDHGVSDPLFQRARRVGHHPQRSREFSRLSRARRLRDFRRLRRTVGLGELRILHDARAARTTSRAPRARGSCLPEFFPYQILGDDQPHGKVGALVLGYPRRRRPRAGGRQLQQRYRRVLGVVRTRVTTRSSSPTKATN